VADTAALVAFTQCLTRLECEEGFASEDLLGSPEALAENRFLAARDGVEAELIEPVEGRRVPLRDLTARLLEACTPHAQDLGCVHELESVGELLANPGALRQLDSARGSERLRGLVEGLARDFSQPGVRA